VVQLVLEIRVSRGGWFSQVLDIAEGRRVW
jgi:hypothetical protein